MTTGQLAFWLIRAGLFQALMPGRLTVEWSDDELALLEAHYCLDGLAYIQRRTGRTADSIRRKASNLDLSSEMKVFMLATELCQAAGTTRIALNHWLDDHQYRRHTRYWGRLLLIPYPAARLYLHDQRSAHRPKGWWSSTRAAEYLGVNREIIRRHARRRTLNTVTHCGTLYIDPDSVRDLKAQRFTAPTTDIPVTLLAAAHGLTTKGTTIALRREGHTPRHHTQPGRAPHLTITLTAARAFLSARGHREEMVDTLLRKAVLMQGSGIKEPK